MKTEGMRVGPNCERKECDWVYWVRISTLPHYLPVCKRNLKTSSLLKIWQSHMLL